MSEEKRKELLQYLEDDLDIVESELIALNRKIERLMMSRKEIMLAIEDVKKN